MRIKTILRRFRRDRRGAVSIEFGILASMLVGVLFSAVEYSRYILTQHKADTSVAAVGDMVSQYTVINSDNMKDIFNAASQILSHYQVKGKGLLIVSHIYAAKKNQPKITWQEFSSESLKRASKLGAKDETPTLPKSFTMDAGETVIAVEGFIRFEPMLFDLVVSNQDIYKIAWYHPRKAEQVAYTKTGSTLIDTVDCGNVTDGKVNGKSIGYLVCGGQK